MRYSALIGVGQAAAAGAAAAGASSNFGLGLPLLCLAFGRLGCWLGGVGGRHGLAGRRLDDSFRGERVDLRSEIGREEPDGMSDQGKLYLRTAVVICMRPSALAASDRTSSLAIASARIFMAALAIAARSGWLASKPCRNALSASRRRS